MAVSSPSRSADHLENITATQFEASIGALSVDELDRLARLTSLTEEQARVLSTHLVMRAESLMPKSGEHNGGGHLPIAQRLAIWWQDRKGSPPPEVTGDSNLVEIGELASETTENWSKDRVRAVQTTWGDGFMGPGGRSFSKKFLGLARVNSSHTVLDMTAGLAGTAAHAAKDEDIWIDAIELDPELAVHAHAIVNKWGVGKRVKLRHGNIENLELPARHYDVAYSRERLFAIEDKKLLLRQVTDSLKQDGALLLTDFTIVEDEAHHEALKEWSSCEPDHPHPWTSDFYRQALEHFGYEIRYNQDISEEFVDLIQQGWLKAVREIENGGVAQRIEQLQTQDGEVWLARAKALKSGALSMRKIYACLKSAPDPE